MLPFNQHISRRINQWFGLIPKGNHSNYARTMLKKLECTQNDLVLDPFCGSGATLIECQLAGVKSIGFEINPFLRFISNTITTWDIDLKDLRKDLDRIIATFERDRKGGNLETLDRLDLVIPPINKPFSWWREDVLVELLVLKNAINKETSAANHALFLFAMAGVLVPELSNTSFDGYQLVQVNRDDETFNVLKSFIAKLEAIIADLADIQSTGVFATSRCDLQDSTDLTPNTISEHINGIVTSPPYPDRYSFTWNTIPHLFFFDYHSSPQEASALDESGLGGTWGSATFKLMRGRTVAAYPVIEKFVEPVAASIRPDDNLAANHLIKYFNLMAKHFLALDKLPQKDLRVAYFIGTTDAGGRIIENDLLLAEVIEGLKLGYRVDSIEDCGAYLEKKPCLRQKIVYAWKQ